MIDTWAPVETIGNLASQLLKIRFKSFQTRLSKFTENSENLRLGTTQVPDLKYPSDLAAKCRFLLNPPPSVSKPMTERVSYFSRGRATYALLGRFQHAYAFAATN